MTPRLEDAGKGEAGAQYLYSSPTHASVREAGGVAAPIGTDVSRLKSANFSRRVIFRVTAPDSEASHSWPMSDPRSWSLKSW